MQTSELVRLTVKELQELAKKLKIQEISGVRKQAGNKLEPLWGPRFFQGLHHL